MATHGNMFILEGRGAPLGISRNKLVSHRRKLTQTIDTFTRPNELAYEHINEAVQISSPYKLDGVGPVDNRPSTN